MALTIRRYSPPVISLITVREFPDLFFLCIGAFAPVVLLSLLALQLCDAYIFGALTPFSIRSSNALGLCDALSILASDYALTIRPISWPEKKSPKL